jgi:4-oxalocrotonate tautomerase
VPIINIQMLVGRTPDQKRRLVASITDAMVDCIGARRASVNVIINEVASENWAQDGGLFSDREGADGPGR